MRKKASESFYELCKVRGWQVVDSSLELRPITSLEMLLPRKLRICLAEGIQQCFVVNVAGQVSGECIPQSK